MAESSPDDRPRRIPIWAPGLALVGVLAVAGILSVWRGRAGQLQEAVAEADRLDPGWRWAHLQERLTPVADGDNAALPVLDVARALPPELTRPPTVNLRVGGHPVLGPLLALAPPQAPSPDLARELEAALAPYRALVARALPAATRPGNRLPVPYDPATPEAARYFEQWHQIQAVSNLLSLSLWQRLQEGDLTGADATLRAQFALARMVDEMPFIEAHTLRAHLETTLVAALERTVARLRLPDPALARLEQTLADARRQNPLLDVLRAERALQHALYGAQAEGRIPAPAVPAPTSPLGRLNLATNHALVLRFLTARIELERYPTPANRRRLAEAEAALDPGGLFAGEVNPAVQVVANLRKGIAAEQHRQAALGCAEVGLAVARYRQRCGQWPSCPEELVPAFLEAVPPDPFERGSGVGLRRTPEGVVVFSAGLATGPMAGEVGFRLWDLERQPQRATP